MALGLLGGLDRPSVTVTCAKGHEPDRQIGFSARRRRSSISCGLPAPCGPTPPWRPRRLLRGLSGNPDQRGARFRNAPNASTSESENGTLWNVPLLLRLDVGTPNYFAPLFCFVGDQLAEIFGRATDDVTEFREFGLNPRLAEREIDLIIELRDDLRRNPSSRCNAIPCARTQNPAEIRSKVLCRATCRCAMRTPPQVLENVPP